MTVSSRGGASETWPSSMGVYKITNITHSGRPVWQSTVREDRYLFFNGNNMILANNTFSIFLGDWSRWVVSSEVSNSGANIASKKQGLVYIPVRGWQYGDGTTVHDDDTLTVTGKHMSYLTIN